jgi:hypothetical protein
MLELATPDLYRVNVFRVLGLPVDVSSGELVKQQKKMKMLEKLGADSHAQPAVLPLDPPPNGDDIRKAGQRLRDPESRLVHELLWFWPAVHGRDSDGDSEIGLLRHGDLTGAHRQWTRLAEQGGRHWSVAAHNLAVLHHTIALDMERTLAEVEPPDPKAAARLAKHWELAFKHWSAVVGDDAIWDQVTGRVRELDDPRLTTGVARRLRRTLPILLVSISVRLAIASARRGDANGARQHLARASGLDSCRVAAVLEREATPLVDQIKQICERIPERSQADPGHADELAQQLMSDTKPMLSHICTVLDQDHYLRQAAMDIVAETVLACARAFGKETGNWHKCSALLEQALSLAASDSLREQIQADKTTVAGLTQSDEVARFCEAAVEAVEANRAAADGEASRVLREASVLIVRLQQSGLDEAAISQAKDMLAMTAMQCAVIYGNTTENWTACAQILRGCLNLAVGQEAQGKIAENLHTVEKNAKFGDLQRIKSAPSLENCNGWLGFTLYGCSDYDPETASHMATYYFILAAIPVFPICRYRVIQNGNSYRFLGKAPLRRGDKIHLRISIGLILLLIAIWLISSASGTGNSSSRSAVPNDNPTPRYSSPQPTVPPPTYGNSGLSSRIESGKARANSMESEIARMDSNLESLSSQISRYKREIEGYERQSRLGIDVDRSLYQQALDSHNTLVGQYNSLLAERKAKYAEYSREIDSVNDMVRRYNSGER